MYTHEVTQNYAFRTYLFFKALCICLFFCKGQFPNIRGCVTVSLVPQEPLEDAQNI